ncbi:MAG: hypothetical protein BMS9Abin37_1391 [Acidobacteriota bacterium]|nr:MAG: hypothetical protein BMS9Abin37_1391 [Acidobacteriota bacterium]
MTLDKSTRLGHYEVLEPIGAGGMERLPLKSLAG